MASAAAPVACALAEDEDGKAETTKIVAILRASVTVLLAAGYANLQARQLLTAQTARPMGEAAVTQATKGLATAFSVGSIVEFFVSPYFGRFSDRYGRKPLFLSFLVAPALMRALCVLVKQPLARIRLLQLDFISVRVLGVQPTQAVVGTMISDIVPAPVQPRARSQIIAAVALGQFIGNYAGGWWNAKYGAQSTYAMIAAIPALLFVGMSSLLPETHPALRNRLGDAPAELPGGQDQKADVQASAAVARKDGPSAARLVLRDPECCLLAAILGLYEFMAYPGLSTVSILFMQDRLGWGPLGAGKFSSAIGAAVFIGSSLAARLMEALGSARHVSFAHSCTALAYLIWGTATGPSGMAACLVPLGLGTGAQPVIMTRFMRRAEQLGAGRGEASAVIQAIGAASRTIAPQIFINMYLRAKVAGARGRLPLGSPMLFLSLVALLQEVLHQVLQRLPHKELAGGSAADAIRLERSAA